MVQGGLGEEGNRINDYLRRVFREIYSIKRELN